MRKNNERNFNTNFKASSSINPLKHLQFNVKNSSNFEVMIFYNCFVVFRNWWIYNAKRTYFIMCFKGLTQCHTCTFRRVVFIKTTFCLKSCYHHIVIDELMLYYICKFYIRRETFTFDIKKKQLWVCKRFLLLLLPNPCIISYILMFLFKIVRSS